jgi:ATP-dependent protease ClpP protease subunit
MRKPKKNLKPRRMFDFSGKQNADAKMTQLGIHLETLLEHGINFRDRIITIKEEIDSDLFGKIDAALSEMESDNRRAITIRINSEGGSVYDALAIVGRLKSSKCRIITVGFGAVMSAATLILACGDERIMSDIAWFMHHESQYAVEGSHSQVVDAVAQAEKEENQWAAAMESYSKKDAKFWRKVAKDKNAYFTAQELLDMGVIDELI